MRLTRTKMEEVSKLIDNKFEEFKTSLLASIKDLVKLEIESYFDTTYSDPVTNEHIESSKAVREHVQTLLSKQMVLEEKYSKLEKKLDDLEQYTRRPNLRIYGVPIEAHESPATVEKKVIDIIKDCNIGIEVNSLDRAHRIGAKKTTGDTATITTQPIIVRFTSFRDRTKFYRKRKDIKDKMKFGVGLDLTKDRYSMLKKARERIEAVGEGIKFVYADINCELRAFTSKGKHARFESLTDLEQIILEN